jgi:GDP-mannose 6-dehydrogenase
MRVAVFGLGYVGAVSAACLASRGHHVWGVDIDSCKVAALNSGRSPVVESGLGALIAEATESLHLRATTDVSRAVRDAEVLLVCVGTPAGESGQVDLRAVREVIGQIGRVLQGADGYRTIVMRSTVPPGTMEQLVRPLLERRTRQSAGTTFGVASNPEFLREGSSIQDFFEPPYVVVGTDDRRAAATLRDLYRCVAAPLHITSFRVAELLKYGCNAFHALKVTFANEMGALAKELSIDGAQLMELLCADTKLNISSRYLRPGFAYGGSCLPKDLRALTHRARTLDVDVPLLCAIEESNRVHFERGLEAICALGRQRIGLLGLGFKPGTDDLRGSPFVELAERLIERGFEVRAYDPHVRASGVAGLHRGDEMNGNGNSKKRSRHRAGNGREEGESAALNGLSHVLQAHPSHVIDWASVLVIGSWKPPNHLIGVHGWADKVAVQLALPSGGSGWAAEPLTLWSEGSPVTTDDAMPETRRLVGS